MVSVVVPIYNVGKYLPRMLDSLLTQTYREFEAILIDDGSTDGSSDIVDEYSKRDERIRVIHQKNKGVSKARNIGLQYCRGEFVYFADSDDEMLPRCLEILVGAMSDDVDGVIGGYERVTRQGSVEYKTRTGYTRFLTRSDVVESIYKPKYLHDFGMLWLMLYRREIIERGNLSFCYTMFEDSLFNVRYALACKQPFVFVSNPIYRYTVDRDGSIMNSDFNGYHGKMIQGLKARIDMYRLIKEKKVSVRAKFYASLGVCYYYNQLRQHLLLYKKQVELAEIKSLVYQTVPLPERVTYMFYDGLKRIVKTLYH